MSVTPTTPLEPASPPPRIPPTIGRHVWYWPAGHDPQTYNPDYPMEATQPHAAIITGVLGPDLVNLTCWNHYGQQYNTLRIRLAQADDYLGYGDVATWMPFQVGQARAQAGGA